MKATGEIRRKGADGALWFGVLAGPVAWLLQLQASYALVLWFCAKHESLPLHLATSTFLAIAIVGGLISLGQWRSESVDEANGPEPIFDRPRFMALLGMMTSSLFALIIIAQWIPVFVLNPCQ